MLAGVLGSRKAGRVHTVLTVSLYVGGIRVHTVLTVSLYVGGIRRTLKNRREDYICKTRIHDPVDLTIGPEAK